MDVKKLQEILNNHPVCFKCFKKIKDVDDIGGIETKTLYFVNDDVLNTFHEIPYCAECIFFYSYI